MKDKAIILKVSEAEHAMTKALADKYGLSVSAFIRMLLHLFAKGTNEVSFPPGRKE